MNLNSYEYYTTSEESDRDSSDEPDGNSTDESDGDGDGDDDFVECEYCSCKLSEINCGLLLKNVFTQSPQIKCEFCNNAMPLKSLQAHIERKHTPVICELCNKSMREKSLPGHIERFHVQKKCRYCDVELTVDLMKKHESDHCEKCKHCENQILKQKIDSHLALRHPFHATIGMIKLDQISDKQFDELVQEQRVYAKDGHLFIK